VLTFLLRRAIYGFTVLLGVVTLVFFLFGLVPDPARELAGQTESEEVVEAIRKKFRLDLSLGHRYVLFINDLSPVSIYESYPESRRSIASVDFTYTELFTVGNEHVVLKIPQLGRSFLSERPVSAILSDALPGTFVLALTAMAFALAVGLFLGVVAALNEGGTLDRGILLISSVGMSGPSFFMAILIAWLGGYLWHESINVGWWLVIVVVLAILLKRLPVGRLPVSETSAWSIVVIIAIALWWLSKGKGLHFTLPGTGLPMNGSLYEVDVWKGQQIAWSHLILPALTLGIRPLAVISQLMRNSVLEVMEQEYVRTARAKGLSEHRIRWRHIMRNALNPVITAASGWLASMLAGAVFVEFVFGWKGLGLEVFRSLEKNDLPVVMGAVLVIAAIFVVINTLVDVLYGWIDPRVRLS
jgi:peptide/nickel transport system permease protein